MSFLGLNQAIAASYSNILLKASAPYKPNFSTMSYNDDGNNVRPPPHSKSAFTFC